MVDAAKRDITVVGAGFMGTVIATLYARHGYRVWITDVESQALDTFRERANRLLPRLLMTNSIPTRFSVALKPKPISTKQSNILSLSMKRSTRILRRSRSSLP